MNKLLINEYPLLILPGLAKAIGLNEAVFLQQVHFLTSEGRGQERDCRIWVYNTYEEWAEIFPFWSVSTIKRTVKSLKETGLIDTMKANKMKLDRTLWYAIDYDVLDRISDSTETDDDQVKMTPPSGQNDTMSLGQNDTTNNHRLKTTNIEKNIKCNFCGKREILDEALGICELCLKKQQKKDFATEVLTSWNSMLKEIPPITTKDGHTMRTTDFKLSVQLRDQPTRREKALRETLEKLYDDPGFRELWRKSLQCLPSKKGLLIQNWFDMEFWLACKKGKQPNYIRLLNGQFDFLTEMHTSLVEVQVFEQEIKRAPGNPGF